MYNSTRPTGFWSNIQKFKYETSSWMEGWGWAPQRQRAEQLQLEILGTDIAWSSRWIYAPKYREAESNQNWPWGQGGREGRKWVTDFAAGVFFGSLSQSPSGNIAGLLDDLRLGRMDRNNCVLFIYRVAWRCHRRRCRPCPWWSPGRRGFWPFDRSPWRCAPTSAPPVDTLRPERRCRL